MLTELVQGRSAAEVATLPRDELLEEIGIPLTPVRLKCALLGLSRSSSRCTRPRARRSRRSGAAWTTTWNCASP